MVKLFAAIALKMVVPLVSILYKLVPNKSIKISPSFSPSQVSEFMVVEMFKSQDWQKKEATN